MGVKKMNNWTPDQWKAITESGNNIIVSAGAGSGKTAVLTERVIYKLKNDVNINNLLVLTFTNAAATEMKDRIRKAIVENGLNEQLDYLDSSYVTTFDSYASSIVRKYHYLLNVPSKIQVVDDTIISIETNKIVDDIFENSYGDTKFDEMISSYSLKDDKEIRNFIIKLNSQLDLKYDKDDYLNGYIAKYFDDLYIDSLVNEYVSSVISKANTIKELYQDMCGYLNEKQCNSLSIYLDKILTSDDFNTIISSSNGKAPGFQKLDENARMIYDRIKNLRKEILGERYTKEELKDNLLLTKNNIEVIISIVKELDKRLTDFKYKNNSFTFTDIAKMAIKVVKDNKDVQDELKNYFIEIMVDEYQDTSDLQEEFLSLISNNNLYMVGDVKQSIYRFRHANPSIFKDKYNRFSNNDGGIKIDLLKNFRSRGEVLDNINSIFDLIMDDSIGNADYRVSHRMVPGNSMYDVKASTDYNMDILTYDKGEEYKDYNASEIEAFIIASDIKNKVESKYQVLDKKTKELRDANYGDFSIIMDRGSSFNLYSKVFEYMGIPTVIWSDEKLNVEDDIAILKNIVNLIIKVRLNEFDQEFRYYFTSVARSYLFEYDDNKILDIFVNDRFKEDDIYKLCLNISGELDSITNIEFLDIIINKFNLYEKSILKGNIDASMIRYDIFAKLFNSLSELGYTPYDLPEYFKNSSDLDIKYSLNSKVSGSVNILNIHKSKGLEFSICYYAGLGSKFNEQDIKTRFLFDDKYGIIIPFNKNGIDNTILKNLSIERYRKEDISEKIRLFYVALTRAKEKMIIVSPIFKSDDYVSNIVSNDIRLNYKSLFNIMDSISTSLNTKLIDLSKLGITDKYNLGKGNTIPNIFSDDKEINHIEISIDNKELKDSHFSKASHKLYSSDEVSKMEFGTYMHYLFEVTDFNNPIVDNKYRDNIMNFINKIDLNDSKIYKEYEFIYEDDNEVKHGIIDLMIEYPDHIDIYDYKLKNTSDDAYVKQLSGYKKYIEMKTKKVVNTYLYSIINDEIRAI